MSLKFQKKSNGGARSGSESGFSLIELMMVCVILIIVSAIAIPNLMLINRSYKLSAAGRALSSLVQQARMQAVKLNQPQYVQYDGAGAIAFVNDGSTASYVNGNMDVGMAGGMSIMAVGAGPTHDQLDNLVGGGNAQIQLGGPLGFNARGLPCLVNGNTCATAGGIQAFEWFVQDGNGGFAAVTVTPAGRIKSWRMTKSSNGNATCGYNACWQ